jgi:hypothetical protein
MVNLTALTNNQTIAAARQTFPIIPAPRSGLAAANAALHRRGPGAPYQAHCLT